MVNRNSRQPLTFQVSADLRRRIESGEWEVNSIVPTELSLCEEYGVSRTTMRAAIAQLVEEGLLYRVRGRGTVVSAPKNTVSQIPYSGLRRKIWEEINQIRPSRVGFEFCLPTPNVARKLHISDEQQIVKIERLYLDSTSNLPHTLAYTYLPAENAAMVNLDMLYTTSIGRLLQERGVVSDKIYELLQVSSATEHESELLGIGVGAPVLIIEETRMNRSNEPFYFSKYVMRGDMVSIAFTDDPVSPPGQGA